jgi:hypothetical protein
MNSDLLIVIDGYLSNPERAKACSNLIDQIKSVLPYKIALFNKFSFSWGLDSKVDYYWNHTEGFMLGTVPQEYLDKELYERPYVYVNTSIGIAENWLPLVGVQDHAANIYNSFIFASEAAKNLGYKRIFRIEADTDFDLNDLKSLIPDLNSFKDYLLYGERKEQGNWGKDHHRIMDLHMIGFSVNLFQEFDIVYNDKDFWKLCEKINYYGKWIEYIIPTTIYYQRQKFKFSGIIHPGSVRDRYSNTKFDLINNPGAWVDKWYNIPKPSKVLSHKDDKYHIPNRLGLFYWNEENTPLKIKSVLTDKNQNQLYYNETELSPMCWSYDEVDIYNECILINTNEQNGEIKEHTTLLSPSNLVDLNNRFVKQ